MNYYNPMKELRRPTRGQICNLARDFLEMIYTQTREAPKELSNCSEMFGYLSSLNQPFSESPRGAASCFFHRSAPGLNGTGNSYSLGYARLGFLPIEIRYSPEHGTARLILKTGRQHRHFPGYELSAITDKIGNIMHTRTLISSYGPDNLQAVNFQGIVDELSTLANTRLMDPRIERKERIELCA